MNTTPGRTAQRARTPGPDSSEVPSALVANPAQARIVLLAGLVLCSVCGVLYAWSIFVLPLEHLFGWERSETSMTFTLMISFFSLGMFIGGRLLQRFSPFHTVLAGGLLLCAGLLGASMVTSLSGLYLWYGVCAGFGVGMVNLVPAAVCLRWYPAHRGIVSGLLTLALALGTLVFGTFGAGALIEHAGVQSAFRILAFVFLGSILLSAGFLRMPPQNLPHMTTDASALSNIKPEAGVPLSDMLRTSTYWMIWSWMLVVQIGGLMIIGHIVPYALEMGLTTAQAALAMGVYAVANGVGRLFFGYIHDRLGRTSGMVLGALFMGTGLLMLVVLPPVAGLVGFFAATVPVAMAYGGTIPQLSALIMAFFGPRFFGVNYGFSTSPLMVASLCGPFLGGLVRAQFGDYSSALYVAAFITFLGLIPALRLRSVAYFDS